MTKKIIIILLLLISKSLAAPKPSLFDIKIYDNVDNYSLAEKGQEIFDYSNFLKEKLINYAWMEVEAGYFKMTENENFNKYAVYLEEQDTINEIASEALNREIMDVKIVGIEAYSTRTFVEDENDIEAEYRCISVRQEFIKIYSNVYQLNTLKLRSENYINELTKNQFIDSLFYNFKFKNKPISIEFACKYELNQSMLKSKLWIYMVTPELKKERFNTLGFSLTNLSTVEIYNKLTLLKGF